MGHWSNARGVFDRAEISTGSRLDFVGKHREPWSSISGPGSCWLAATHSSGVVVSERSVCSRSATFVNAASMSSPVDIGYPAGGVSATRSLSQAASQATKAMALLFNRRMLEFYRAVLCLFI